MTDEKRKHITLTATDRPLIFFHQFKKPDPEISGVKISEEGIYNAGTDATKPYYPYSDIKNNSVRHYISDYPNWTRLVIAQGNFFEVFSERTAADDDIVGARAAVRWVDGVAAGATPGNPKNTRPARTDSNSADPRNSYFSIQPFFSQDQHPTRARDMATGVYREWQTPVTAFPGWIFGRFDLALLRCCDIEDGKEVIINFQKFRFSHKFDPGLPSTFNKTDFLTKTLRNIPKRWNGPDEANIGTPPKKTTFNPGTFTVEPQDSAKKHKAYVRWLVQETPLAQAHFEIDVKPSVRSFMGSHKGNGGAEPGDEQANPTGWFTAAHECGHAGSLPDEYNERWRNCSYQFNGFGCNIGGDPYSLVYGPLMMEGVRDILCHYFWHNAEWMRLATGIPFHVKVDHGSKKHTYKVRQHPQAPNRTFTYFPLIIESNANPGTRGLFDLYLYELGDDKYRYLIHSGKDFDGILIVLVKMRFAFADATQHRHIINSINSVRAAISNRFNGKFKIDSGASLGGVSFKKCLVHFEPRFLIETLVKDGTSANNQYLRGLGYKPLSSATQANYTTKVNDIDKASGHPRHFRINVDQSLATGWGAGNSRVLSVGKNIASTAGAASLGTTFWPYFGDMLGLSLHAGGGTSPTNTNIQDTIVKRLLPSGTVSAA